MTNRRASVAERVRVTQEFRSLVKRLRDHFGSANRAAVDFAQHARKQGCFLGVIDLAVSQATLSRIARGAVQEVQWQTFMALKEHGRRCGIGERGEWQAAVYSPAARRAFDDYYEWLNDERWRIEPTGTDLKKLRQQLREWDDGDKSAWRQILEFREWLGRTHPTRGATRIRHRFAELRALEPLLLGDRAGGMELTAEELQASGKLNAFVKAALERERLILERERDERRAQTLNPHPPESYDIPTYKATKRKRRSM